MSRQVLSRVPLFNLCIISGRRGSRLSRAQNGSTLMSQTSLAPTTQTVELPRATFNVETRELSHGGKRCRLSATEWTIVRRLCAAPPGEFLSAVELRAAYPSRAYTTRGRSRAVHVHIYNIREKFGGLGLPKVIVSSREGYLALSPLREIV
jgi:DNA-binding response OmpR family regulator